MPLGIQRLNAKKSQPNDRIVFIKPLKGKDEAIAQDFLERIAAQCGRDLTRPSLHLYILIYAHAYVPAVPIMKGHHLSVTTLEEYEPNREFVGRNFNNGEIIQLVLKARSGQWLPFNYVQMVMMHELAHNVQMNHSRAFWKVRNLYADQMRAIWERGYTGEGMWGRGALLATGQFESNTVAEGEELPGHLCGGTYRSRRGRKRGRKAGPDLSYQERKQRRIEKKFGKDGVALGADDDVKAKLEKGKRTQAAPRVAKSNRGRDLRAAAALARFEQQKDDTKEGGNRVDDDSCVSDEDSDYEDAENPDLGVDDAIDIDGKRLLDTKGNRMVKICEDENPNDEDAANELKELQSSITKYFAPHEGEDAAHKHGRQGRMEGAESHPSRGATSTTTEDPASYKAPPTSNKAPSHEVTAATPICPVCSFENETYTVTCSMCLHVLDATSVPGTWKCRSASCDGSVYLNAGDCGTCGVCGQRKGGET